MMMAAEDVEVEEAAAGNTPMMLYSPCNAMPQFDQSSAAAMPP
jgi:hypothetical protein